MIKSLEDVTKDVIQLPNHQRLALARFLLDLDEPSIDNDLESIWDQEIRERIRAVDNDEAIGIPYDEVLQEIESRFGV
jgi:hypothetical protein